MNATAPHEPIYIHIGRRIRERRKLLKLNQSELAGLMGFSYQQIQKYEAGASRVSAGKLLGFAKILNVPPSYFYDGIKLDEAIGTRIESTIIQKKRTRPLSILLVEDNPADVILFRRALTACSEKTEAEIIHDPETVMDYIHRAGLAGGGGSPDLIIVDLSLPRLNGMELLRAIKKNPATLGLPVLILTNSINIKDMVEAYKNGAAGFIQKSVDLQEYIDAIDSIVTYWAATVALPNS